MNAAKLELPETLRSLVDNRLDTIERVLMQGNTPRVERRSILDDTETQILEMLWAEAGGQEPTRYDLLRVLGRLEPPEAFAGEHVESAQPARRARSSVFGPSKGVSITKPAYSTIGILACVGGLVTLIFNLPAAVFAFLILDDAIIGFALAGLLVVVGLPALVLGILYAIALAQSQGRLRGLTCAAIGITALPISAFGLVGGFLVLEINGEVSLYGFATLVCILAVVGAIHLTYRILELLVGAAGWSPSRGTGPAGD
jgi:hypothetical protein